MNLASAGARVTHGGARRQSRASRCPPTSWSGSRPTTLIEVRLRTQVTRAPRARPAGSEAVTIETTDAAPEHAAGSRRCSSASAASRAPRWAPASGVRTDDKGFLLTGPGPAPGRRGARTDWPLDRDPLALETSIPGVFAAGDVRHGSVKRVAGAVGEGAMAVALAHHRLEELTRARKAVRRATFPLLRCPRERGIGPRSDHGSFRSQTVSRAPRTRGALAAPPAPERRAADRAHPARPPRRLRGARAALPAAAARLLPPHARLAGGRRGRAPGGLHRGVQRDAGRRPADQRAPVALPDRPQPLAQPPAPPAARRPGLDGHLRARRRHHHRRHGAHAARSSARSSPTSRTCPRPSAPPCCCARSTRSRTTRSPRRWTPPCRASSRCSCARACRSPRPPRRGCSPATRCGCELGQVAEGLARTTRAGAPPPQGRATAAAPSAASSARPPARSPPSTRSARSCS